MDPSEINNFENQWKKAFDEASETPPPSVWGEIEARLDRGEKDIMPLWWRKPKLWYAAASIIALLVVGGGYFFNNSSQNNGSGITTEMAVKTPDVTSGKTDKDLADVPSLASAESNTEKTASLESVAKTAPAKQRVTARKEQKSASDKTFDNAATESLTLAAIPDHVSNSLNIAGNTAKESLSKGVIAFE
ncbi:MAG TPA: hypothetical protein VGN64_16410, partial [Dyadobacter sp.]|nr:hypothetical protein [Dyadobacter sp.]